MVPNCLIFPIPDQPITWEIEFYPKGIKYERAKMVWGEDVPEVALNTVRLRVTCRYPEIDEQRFKVFFFPKYKYTNSALLNNYNFFLFCRLLL